MATKSQTLRKDQILSSLTAARRNILTEASKLSESERNQVFLGVWSVKDILAHLVGWDVTNLQAIKSVLKSKVPAFHEYRDPNWKTYNAMLVKKYKKDSSQELLADVRDSQKQLMEFLQTIPPENFNKDFGVRFRGYKVSIQRLLEAETGDEQTHFQQIVDFFKEAR